MTRYFIEAVKCGVSEDGMACGPVSGTPAASIKFREGDETKWLCLAEADGIPNFILADKDIHTDLVEGDADDDEFIEYLNSHFIEDFNGIRFGLEYSEIFESIDEDPDNPAVPLIRYIIALIRCSRDEEKGLIEMATGKYADELDVPISDVEEMYREEMEDEE